MRLQNVFFLLIFFAFILLSKSYAEYRVYQYTVTAKNPYSMDTSGHVVTSTRDPESYISYHGGQETLKIDLVRSWMCYGDTSNKDLCSPPIAREAASVEAN